MTQDRSAHYRQFFADQAATVAALQRLSLFYTAAFVALLVALLGALQSPLLVWGYVIVAIGFLFGRGILGLKKSATIASESTAHLEIIAGVIKDDPGREAIRAKLDELATPDDNSNVPEALSGFLEGSASSSETVRAVANSAFGHALSKVEFAVFMRTALVLAGLFGTVLFFAFELTRPALLSGDLAVLMPGLRGALASTLSGILGSVMVGWFASRVDALLDSLILETEAFVGGPFLVASSDPLTRPEIHSETELWEALRQEVALMADRSTKSLDRMADDVHAHAASLQAFSDQVANLPELRVPPELSKLEDVVAQFQHSTELLNKTVAPLVEAVGSLGIFAPAQMLEKIDGLAKSTSEWQGSAAGVLGDIKADGASARADLKTARESIEAVPAMLESKLEGIVSAMGGLASGQQVNRIETGMTALASSAELGEVSASITEFRDEVKELPAELQASSAALAEAAERLGPVAAQLEDSRNEIATQTAGLSGVAEEIGTARLALTEALRGMRRLLNWHERADQAPLMKFLLMPLWPRGRLPFTSGRKGSSDDKRA